MLEFFSLPVLSIPESQATNETMAFRATTECPYDWPRLIVAFVAGALVVALLKR